MIPVEQRNSNPLSASTPWKHYLIQLIIIRFSIKRHGIIEFKPRVDLSTWETIKMFQFHVNLRTIWYEALPFFHFQPFISLLVFPNHSSKHFHPCTLLCREEVFMNTKKFSPFDNLGKKRRKHETALMFLFDCNKAQIFLYLTTRFVDSLSFFYAPQIHESQIRLNAKR